MLPSINQLIEISLDDGENFFYKSRVADISNDYFGIDMPIDKKTGRFKVLTEDLEINVSYLNNRGQFSFITKVIGIKKEQIPIILLEHPKEYERLQRRNFIRVPAFVDVAYMNPDDYDITWNVVRTIDISGGGMQLAISNSEYLKLNSEINGWIVLPYNNGKIGHIKFTGRIVRVYRLKEKSDKILVSIEFTNISEVMRAKIIKYCYEKEVKLKKE